MSASTTPTGIAAPRLERPHGGRMIAGVCAGIARHLNVDATLVRLVFVAATLAGGFGIAAYVAAMLLVPEEGRAHPVLHSSGSRRPGMVLGVVLLVIGLGAALDGLTDGDIADGAFWAIVLIGGGAYLLLRPGHRDTAPVSMPATDATAAVPAAARRSRRATRAVAGCLLLAAGVTATLAAAGVSIGTQEGIGIAVVAAGGVLVAGAFFGASPWLAIIPLSAVAIVGTLAAAGATLDGPIGERSFTPATSADLPSEYRVAIGELHVDLSDTAFATGVTRLKVHVGVGESRITVPDDVTVRIDAHAGAGDIHLPGGQSDGTDVDRHETLTASGGRVLELDADVGLGDLRVERAGR